MNGLFITFEGPDGAGKTTQIHRISKWLDQEGIPHICTCEPGGTSISDHVRELLLNPMHSEMADATEVLLYAASRAQLVNEVIRPALREGCHVLCDRFVDASLAYQGYGLELPIEEIARINRFATGGLVPNRTYLLDIPVDMGLNRILKNRGTKPDRIEAKNSTYHDRVRSGFQILAEQQPERFYQIDARQAESTVFSLIQADLKRIFSLGGNG